MDKMDNNSSLANYENKPARSVYFAYIWHGFFLALTLSMLDLNTVFPSLIAKLTSSKIIFGLFYAIMLGSPLIFNLVFSHYLRTHIFKKKFLLAGIYLRAIAFLGMAVSIWIFSGKFPRLTIFSFFLWVFLFSVSAGFAGIAYSDMLGKTLASRQRTQLFATKQLVASLAAFGGGLLITGLFSPGRLPFPSNYAVSLTIGFAGLMISSFGFYFVKEPASQNLPEQSEAFSSYVKGIPDMLKKDKRLRRFIVVENLASFSVMVLPFYIIFAQETFELDQSYIGKYLLVQVTGTVLSNFVWGILARKQDSRVIVRTCILIGAVIPLLALLLIKTTPDLYGVIFFLLGFVVSGRLVGFEPFLLDIAPDQKRTEYLGIRGTLNILTVVLPILGGLFISLFGYEITFILVSTVMLVSVWLSRRSIFVVNDA